MIARDLTAEMQSSPLEQDVDALRSDLRTLGGDLRDDLATLRDDLRTLRRDAGAELRHRVEDVPPSAVLLAVIAGSGLGLAVWVGLRRRHA